MEKDFVRRLLPLLLLLSNFVVLDRSEFVVLLVVFLWLRFHLNHDLSTVVVEVDVVVVVLEES